MEKLNKKHNNKNGYLFEAYQAVVTNDKLSIPSEELYFIESEEILSILELHRMAFQTSLDMLKESKVVMFGDVFYAKNIKVTDKKAQPSNSNLH